MKQKSKSVCSIDMLKNLIAESYSWAEVLRRLDDLNYYCKREYIQQMAKENNINVEHFTGQGWNKGNIDITRFTNDSKSEIHFQDVIKLRGHRCEKCGLTSWLDQKIPLELHHIDGNRRNNDLSNLQLLCPNCHSLTDTFRGRNINCKEKVSEEEFKNALIESKNIRQALLKLGLTAKGLNYSRAYEIAVKYNIRHILEH